MDIAQEEAKLDPAGLGKQQPIANAFQIFPCSLNARVGGTALQQRVKDRDTVARRVPTRTAPIEKIVVETNSPMGLIPFSTASVSSDRE